jgi:hypothetical protein
MAVSAALSGMWVEAAEEVAPQPLELLDAPDDPHELCELNREELGAEELEENDDLAEEEKLECPPPPKPPPLEPRAHADAGATRARASRMRRARL